MLKHLGTLGGSNPTTAPTNARFKKIVFLGTSSAVPRPGFRNMSSMAIVFSTGRWVMIDCGEGTQHQLLMSPLSPAKLDAIFVTHLHSDHVYGIFGLLHTIGMGGDREEPLLIVGPPGIRRMVMGVLNASGGWHAYPLRFRELTDRKQAETLPRDLLG